MKKIISLCFAIVLISASTSFQSCNRKSGCQYNDTKAETNRKGELKTKRGSTSLYPKKMRKG